uniref:ATS domain-containing protein n=1 Tax=Strongyloides venezuelensis TaxID=75913 RepID=A0A0K0FH52_STRVS
MMNNINMATDYDSFKMKDLISCETSNKPTDPHFSMALCLANSVLMRNTYQNEDNDNVSKVESMNYNYLNELNDHVLSRTVFFKEFEKPMLSLYQCSNLTNNFEIHIMCSKNYYTTPSFYDDRIYYQNYANNSERMDILVEKNECPFEKFTLHNNPFYSQCISMNSFLINDSDAEDSTTN